MREGRQKVKVEATGSTRYHITLWKRIGFDRTSFYTDELIHSVFPESSTLFQFKDSDTQIQTIYYYITEKKPVLKHWWVVYALFLLCLSTACFITLSNYTQHFYIVDV